MELVVDWLEPRELALYACTCRRARDAVNALPTWRGTTGMLRSGYEFVVHLKRLEAWYKRWWRPRIYASLDRNEASRVLPEKGMVVWKNVSQKIGGVDPRFFCVERIDEHNGVFSAFPMPWTWKRRRMRPGFSVACPRMPREQTVAVEFSGKEVFYANACSRCFKTFH